MFDRRRSPPFRSLTDRTLESRYRFFRAHAGYRVGFSAADAMTLARAEQAAEDLGLTIEWDDEDMPWDGDCPAPTIHVMACVRHPRSGHVIASLGSIGLESWRDPYVRVVSAELFSEALDTLSDEAREAAELLASRATLAGPYR